MRRSTAAAGFILVAGLITGLAGCAGDNGNYSWMQRSPAYQPNAYGIYAGSGTAAGWGDLYRSGYGYANPLTDPGPAGAGLR